MAGPTATEIDFTFPPVVELRRRLDIYLQEFHRENDLVDRRMTWFVMSQSFLAVADAAAGQQGNRLWLMTVVIPLVGFLISLLARFSIRASLDYQQGILTNARELVTQLQRDNGYDDQQLAAVVGPWAQRDPRDWRGKTLASRTVPLILAGFWIVVCVVAINVYILA